MHTPPPAAEDEPELRAFLDRAPVPATRAAGAMPPVATRPYTHWAIVCLSWTGHLAIIGGFIAQLRASDQDLSADLSGLTWMALGSIILWRADRRRHRPSHA